MCEEEMWLHTVPEAALKAKTPILSSSSMLTYESHKGRYIKYIIYQSNTLQTKAFKLFIHLTCAGTLLMFLMTRGRICLLSTSIRLNCRTGCPCLVLWTGFRIVIQGKLPSPTKSNTSTLLLPKGNTLIKTIKTKYCLFLCL